MQDYWCRSAFCKLARRQLPPAPAGHCHCHAIVYHMHAELSWASSCYLPHSTQACKVMSTCNYKNTNKNESDLSRAKNKGTTSTRSPMHGSLRLQRYASCYYCSMYSAAAEMPKYNACPPPTIFISIGSTHAGMHMQKCQKACMHACIHSEFSLWIDLSYYYNLVQRS